MPTDQNRVPLCDAKFQHKYTRFNIFLNKRLQRKQKKVPLFCLFGWGFFSCFFFFWSFLIFNKSQLLCSLTAVFVIKKALSCCCMRILHKKQCQYMSSLIYISLLSFGNNFVNFGQKKSHLRKMFTVLSSNLQDGPTSS